MSSFLLLYTEARGMGRLCLIPQACLSRGRPVPSTQTSGRLELSFAVTAQCLQYVEHHCLEMWSMHAKLSCLRKGERAHHVRADLMGLGASLSPRVNHADDLLVFQELVDAIAAEDEVSVLGV